MTLSAEIAALLIVGAGLPLVGVGVGWSMATARADRRELRAAGPPAQPPPVVVVGQLGDGAPVRVASTVGWPEPGRLGFGAALPQYPGVEAPRVIRGELA